MLQRKCSVKLCKGDLFLNNRHLFDNISNDLVKDNVKAESVLINGGTLKQEKEDVVFKIHSEYITPDPVIYNNNIILETIKEGNDVISDNDSHVEDEDSCSDWEADYSRDTGVCLKNYCKNRKCETILNNDVEKKKSPNNILKIQDKTENDNDANTLRSKSILNYLLQPDVQLQRKTNCASNSVQFITSLNKKSNTENPLQFYKGELSCFLCDKQFYSFNTLFEHLMKVHDLHDIQRVQPSKESTSVKSHRKVIHAPRKHEKVSISSDCKNSSSLQCPIEKDKINKFDKKDIVSKKNDNKNMVEEEMFMCVKCEKFYVKDKYTSHIKYSSCNRNWQSRAKKFRCEICGAAFDSSSKLTGHINSHTNKRPFKCADCEKHFNSKTTRYIHEKNMHQKKRKIYLCYYCGITHVSLPHLLAHEKTHLLPEGVEVPTPFQCQKCGRGYISKYLLTKHKSYHHKLLKCSKCPELFQNSYHRKKHLDKVHNTVKEHKCDICSKVFKNQKSIACHKFVHTTVLSFFCDVCDKGFKQKHHLEQHLITHSDYRPIVCPECGETFKRKTHLKQHVAAFHGDGKKR